MEFKNGNTFATTAFTSYGGWYNHSSHIFKESFRNYVEVAT
jgi:succinate-acetate transporter protein